MTWNEAIDAGCQLAGVNYSELARRLGYKQPSSLAQMRRGTCTPSIVRFTAILDALGISGGYDGATGWWVARPEDVKVRGRRCVAEGGEQ